MTKYAASKVSETQVGFVPTSVNSTPDFRGGLHEWPVFPLLGGIEPYLLARFSTLRAHAVRF